MQRRRLDSIDFPLLWGVGGFGDLDEVCRRAMVELESLRGGKVLLPEGVCPASVLGAIPSCRRRDVMVNGLDERDCVCIAVVRILGRLAGARPDFMGVLLSGVSLPECARQWCRLLAASSGAELAAVMELGEHYGSLRIFRQFVREGMLFRGYSIERCLGQGGVSKVYLVRRGLDKYALKMPIIRDDARFRRECEIASGLPKEYFPIVHEVGAAEGVGMYMVMEVLDMDREKIRKAGPEDYVEALNCLHVRRILHGDVRWANLGLRPSGGGVMLDFSHAVTDDGFSESRAAGEIRKLVELFEQCTVIPVCGGRGV